MNKKGPGPPEPFSFSAHAFFATAPSFSSVPPGKPQLRSHLLCVNIDKMTVYSYPITIQREGKHYYAYSDDFPGVYGLGKTVEGAKHSILKAMRLYTQRCRKNRRPVPPTRTVYAETVTLALD